MKNYVVDYSHSSITFSVKHMMITNVKGTFDSYHPKITARSLEQFTDAQISIEIDVASISTKDVARDNHLRSEDFFHADRYPKIKFEATNIKKVENNLYHIKGDLTIKDITKPVTFITTYTGHVKSPWGDDTYGFISSTKINRKQFNLLYNATLESGGLLLGEDIDVQIEFQVIELSTNIVTLSWKILWKINTFYSQSDIFNNTLYFIFTK